MPPDIGDPEAAIAALTAVGIDFSVAKNDLLDWLGNPEFTPYPAIAEALLQLLGAKALQRPVFIDVIVGFYENSPGNPSPRRVEDVDMELLKRAIVAGFNERYGEQNAEFESLLKPPAIAPINVGFHAARRAIREARREREAAWREVFNSHAQADDIWRRTRTMRDDQAASVFGQPFVEARTQAENGRTGANTRGDAVQERVEAVEHAWDSETSNDPLWPDGGGDLPIMLLPVRIETLFRPTALGGAELWIRVYPDDIHIDTHETALTPAERAAGERYWSVVDGPAVTAEAKAAAWAEVVAAVGAARGLWSVECLRGGADSESRTTTWTRPPLARLMPHHFTFSGYRDGRLMWRIDGAPVASELPAGFAPPGIEQVEGDDDAAPGSVPWQRGSRWLVDFDAAVAAGMAVRVPLQDPNLHYDLVTVIGLGSDDPDTSARNVRDLFVAHGYVNGLSVLAAGTPTNNTPGSRSGWHSRPQPRSPDEADQARRELATAGAGAAAQRMATALGIDAAESLAPIVGGLRDPDDLAATAHRFVGRLLGGLSNDWLPMGTNIWKGSADVGFLYEHFVEHVRSRGPLPALRIGRQPYGILPVTPTDLWRGDDVNEAIVFGLYSVLSYFKENVHRAQRVGTGRDQDAAILDLLSRRPASNRIRYIRDLDLMSNYLSFAMPPPATVGITALDMKLPFAMRGPIGNAPAGYDFTAALDPTPELLKFVATRPLQAFGDMITETQEFMAGLPPDAQAEFPPELVEKMQAINATVSQLDPVTSGLFYQLALPLFRNLWWASVMFGFPSRIPDNHESFPIALALHQFAQDAIALEDVAAERFSELEQALCECLDTTSHRVDAWATSLATARLAQIRADNPTGLRTGAYGWVADLEPLPPGRGPERDGYIVTPSLHHATTAAVLRSGCLAHSNASALAVNLTSARVRKALWTIDGIKQGQSLDYLLGYRFERALHDLSLDHLIPAFRERYPIAPQVDSDADNAQAARTAVAARHVVDGLALSRDRAAFDADDPTVPVGDDLPTVRGLIADLADTFDAASDILLAESVHHLVGGNPLRAGLAADATSRGLLPDNFEVISTPRSAETISYAVGAALSDDFDPGGGWSVDNGLAQLEPALENWCRARLGEADSWTFRCRRADGSTVTVTVADVSIGALEAVRTIDASSASTFASRLFAAARANVFADDDSVDRYRELATLAESLRTAIATSTPLLASHFDPIADPWATADLDDLASRVHAWSTRVQQATDRLEAAAATTPVNAADITAAIRELIGCGIAFPADTDLADLDHLGRVAAQIVTTVRDANPPEHVAPPPAGPARDSTSTLEWVAKITAPVERLTGGGVPILPRLTLDGTGIADVLAPLNRPVGAADDQLDDWLRDIGRVRPAIRSLDNLLAATELIAGTAAPGFVVTQAPATQQPPWIAVSRAGARSCTVLAVDGDISATQVTGVVFDSWSEVLPKDSRQPGTAEEVAGIAFHTARPDARAPQAILVAVPPDRSRGWHAEDVHAAVEEAYELAQVRGMDLADLPELRSVMPPVFEGGEFTVGVLG